MSRRYTATLRSSPTDLIVHCHRLDATIEQLKDRNRALRGDLAAAARRHLDLEGANDALIAEVNALRAALRGRDERLAVAEERIAVCRAINVVQARTITAQGTQLVAAWEALGVMLHSTPADLDRARLMVEAVITRKEPYRDSL